GNVALASVALAGPDNASSCNRSTALAPGDSYVCKSVRHVVTQGDLDAGAWTPTFTATGTTATGTKTTHAAAMSPVDLTLPAAPPPRRSRPAGRTPRRRALDRRPSRLATRTCARACATS